MDVVYRERESEKKGETDAKPFLNQSMPPLFMFIFVFLSVFKILIFFFFLRK